VYATGTGTNNPSAAVISGFDKNALTGSLSAIPASPFAGHEAAPMAVDGQGKFLFVAGPTSIAMYAIDPASGALTEVPSSPFPYIPTINPNQAPSNPLSIATEPTGEYVYVGFQNTQPSPTTYSSITPYVIDTSNSADPVLDLGPQLELDFTNGAPTNLFVDPTGRHLYVALGNSGGNPYSGFDFYDIDGGSGALTLRSSILGSTEDSKSSAMDPAGRFLFQSAGQIGCTLSSYTLSPVDGSETGVSSLVVAYTGEISGAIAVDPSGNFLYFAAPGGPATLSTYSIDQTTGALTLLSTVQTPYPFGAVTVADPEAHISTPCSTGRSTVSKLTPLPEPSPNFRARPSPMVQRIPTPPDSTSPTQILRIPLAPIWSYRAVGHFRKRPSARPLPSPLA